MKEVRVRYAPSPTGHLHIGGARTALFNYLFAKHYGGKFIFRLEDTDLERNLPDGEASQLENLAWLGIIPDESPLNPGAYGPYRQTERLDIYREYVNKLLEAGIAYECYCTPEELEEERKKQERAGNFSYRYDRKCLNLTPEQKQAYIDEGRKPAIRFKVDENRNYEWDDIVRGRISVPGKDISDWVIFKSNGIATYNFAVVIDDILMEMTHIFRGEEHISNTPKQLMIYEAFKAEPPKFGHMTLIVNEERKKLSKRDETIMQFISQYKEEGYLPEAMFNFFALLGWSPDSEQEIYTEEELIKIFDEKRMSKSPSMFDKKKLHWIDNQYIQHEDLIKIKEICTAYLEKELPINSQDEEWLTKVIALFKPQLNYCSEIVELVRPFFAPYHLSAEDKAFIIETDSKDLLETIKANFEKLAVFDMEHIKQCISMTGKELNKKGKLLFMPIRLAVSNERHGGDLPTVLELYGKEQVLENLTKTIALLS